MAETTSLQLKFPYFKAFQTIFKNATQSFIYFALVASFRYRTIDFSIDGFVPISISDMVHVYTSCDKKYTLP